MSNSLFPTDPPVALRQPKTDRLILERYLKEAASDILYGIERHELEYFLSTYQGIHEASRLFPDHCSTAEYILQKNGEIAFANHK